MKLLIFLIFLGIIYPDFHGIAGTEHSHREGLGIEVAVETLEKRVCEEKRCCNNAVLHCSPFMMGRSFSSLGSDINFQDIIFCFLREQLSQIILNIDTPPPRA
tara:strand:- start:12472 stop:12780 length:309 start_codon:yes stop_codon:yes gene_type:complete